jgi:hypothetical protein
VRIDGVEAELVSRAMTAAAVLAGRLGLAVDDVVVLHSSNTLALRLLPCDVVARVAVGGQAVAALEVEVARQLTAVAGPVAALAPGVEPRPHDRDGFTVTFWTYYESVVPGPDAPARYADALHRLHAGLRTFDIETPHVLDRVAGAERLVADRHRSPTLAETDRHLLLSTLEDARARISARGTAEQLLHGEPHPGNLLHTTVGPLFIDLETCCRGPVEFDVAHVPDEVSPHYPDLDDVLLAECRRLVLAMVAAWRWDVRDEFPHGPRHGRDILAILRHGPPWLALGPLTAP